jgi:hypothetical protein
MKFSRFLTNNKTFILKDTKTSKPNPIKVVVSGCVVRGKLVIKALLYLGLD